VSERQQRRGGGGLGEGIRTGLGVLNAFREAVEETFQEAVRRGDLSPERAGEAVREAMRRAQDNFEEARDRLEFVPRKEYEVLSREVEELRERVERLESRSAGDSSSGPGEITVSE
jgi:polyhydroxyalkanoate synthesis regulator phasin